MMSLKKRHTDVLHWVKNYVPVPPCAHGQGKRLGAFLDRGHHETNVVELEMIRRRQTSQRLITHATLPWMKLCPSVRFPFVIALRVRSRPRTRMCDPESQKI